MIEPVHILGLLGTLTGLPGLKLAWLQIHLKNSAHGPPRASGYAGSMAEEPGLAWIPSIETVSCPF
jgi:hypothetical protein